MRGAPVKVGWERYSYFAGMLASMSNAC